MLAMMLPRLLSRTESRLVDVARADNFLPLQRMHDGLDQWRSYWQQADPFPHICIDGLFDHTIIASISAEFPPISQQKDWVPFRQPNEWQKNATANDRQIPFFTRQFLYALNSRTFVEWLEALSGIKGLISDSEFIGGGLHSTMPGGRLGIHTDFNKHQRNGLDRRLNLLLFLNENWDERWGGQLELWDAEVKHRGQSIAPLFNRLVIFATTDYTYHGHPEPLSCPEGMFRKSIALYYYSRGRPAEEQSTSHLTQYREPPGDAT
jgi:hypothetical protein